MAASSTGPDGTVQIHGYHPARERAGSLTFAVSILFWLGLLVRLAIAAPFLHFSIALDDMLQYDMLARSLISENGYRWYSQADLDANRPYLEQVLDYSTIHVPPEGVLTTFRPPGYPFFLAGLYLVFPFASRWMYTRLVQCALGACLGPLAALLAVRMGFGKRAAWISGLGAALYPILQMYPIALASENLFIPLLTLSVLALLWSVKKASYARLAAAGVVMGLTVLTRSVISPAAFVAALWITRYSPRKRRGALVFLAVTFGLCLPWAVRNSIISRRPTFIETALGYQMYIGYHPDGDGGFASEIAIQPLHIIDDAERDRYCWEAVKTFIRADPAGSMLRMARRAAYFFAAEDRELIYFYTNNFFGPIAEPWLFLLYLIVVLPWAALVVLAILGGARGFREPAVLLVIGFAVAYILPHLLIIAEPRFHLALVPLLLPLAAYGWAGRKGAIWGAAHPKRLDGKRGWVILALLATFTAWWVWGFISRWDNLVAIFSVGGNTLGQFY